MDASQITKLLQKQNTRYINRNQTVDASTLIWQNQIQASKYIKGVKTCDGQQNTNVPINPACPDVNGICSFGGSGRTTSLQTGSPQKFLNVLSGASGSASQVYSSESITLQRAGKEYCGVPVTSPAPQNSYVVLPACYCVNTNGPTNSSSSQLSNPTPTPVNNQSNPYLPPFDTYYAMKNPSALNKYPIQDQNQKHYIKECHTRFPNANNGENAVFNPNMNVTKLDPVTKKFYTTNENPLTCEGCIIEPVINNTLSESIINNTLSEPIPIPINIGQLQWVTYLDGTDSDIAYDVTIDSSDNIYITGTYTSSSSVTIYNANGTGQIASSIILPSSTSGAAFLIKYNLSGIAQWATYLDGTAVDVGLEIATDSSGNVYLSGIYTSLSSVRIYNANGTGQIASSISLPSSTLSAAFLIKYNSSGIAQWATYLNGTGADITNDIEIDPFGNAYLSGIYTSSSSVTIYNANGTGQIASSITLPSSTSGAGFLIKYNSFGTALWATYLNGIGVDFFRDITSDSSGNIYVTGYYNSSSSVRIYNANGIGQIVSSIRLPSSTSNALLLIKYNSLGISQWATYLNGTGSVNGYKIIAGSLENIYMVGFYNSLSSVRIYNANGTGQIASSISLPSSTSDVALPSSTSDAGFLIKYNSSGIAQWATYLNGTGADITNDVQIDPFGNIYVTGYYNSSSLVRLYNANGTGQIASSITLPSSTSDAGFLIKYNSSGIAQLAIYLDGTNEDRGQGMAIDSFGNIYISGYYTSSSSIKIYNANETGQVALSITLPSSTSGAVFLLKYI